MEKELEREVQEVQEVQVTEQAKPDGLYLSDAEKSLIESQRQEVEKLEEFKRGYQQLVERTGFAWGVDGTSPLNSPKIGIGKVNG